MNLKNANFLVHHSWLRFFIFVGIIDIIHVVCCQNQQKSLFSKEKMLLCDIFCSRKSYEGLNLTYLYGKCSKWQESSFLAILDYFWHFFGLSGYIEHHNLFYSGHLINCFVWYLLLVSSILLIKIIRFINIHGPLFLNVAHHSFIRFVIGYS